MAAVGEQLVGAECAGGDHHAPRGQRRAPLAHPRPGVLAGHPVAIGAVLGAALDRADVGDLALGEDLDAELLREPEVVLDERVLGVVAAAHHAASAADAAGARRPLAPEVRVGHLLARLAEEGAHPRVLVGVARADLLAVLLQEQVSGALERIVGHPEHSLGCLVVGVELRLPLAQRVPLRVAEEGGPGPVERVRVAEAAPADAGAGDDEDVLEDRHPEDPAEPDLRHPVVAAEVPGGLREVLVAVAAPALEDRDPVALLGEAQRGHRSAEAGADHDPVVVEASPRFVHRPQPS